MLPKESIIAIRIDINRIDASFKDNHSFKDKLNLLKEMDGKYSAYINNWSKSMYHYRVEYGFLWDYFDDENLDSLDDNLKLAKSKIEGLLIFPKEQSSSMSITQIATQNTQVSIDIVVENVIESLVKIAFSSDSEYQDIKNQIKLLEKLIKNEPKRTRWEKSKGILKWLMDKSVDVFIAALPLIYKINQ